MKNILYYILPLCFALAGCIEPYHADIKGIESILVVEGFITGGTTQITLTKSVNPDVSPNHDFIAVDHALVYVACDDGTQSDVTRSSGNGKYLIPTGELKMDAKYCLVIQSDDHEYRSEFLSLPAIAPPINVSLLCDSVDIHVSVNSHGNDGQTGYYLWSYKEDWEIHSYMYGPWVYLEIRNRFGWISLVRTANDLRSVNNRYYCWRADSSKYYIMGTTDNLTDNNIRERKLLSFPRTDDRIFLFYHVQVTQNRVHKEAYDYFYNVQKNMEQTGSIFGHIPSEIKGNIRCITNPDIPVIGYVEVCTASMASQWLDNKFYDPSVRDGKCVDPFVIPFGRAAEPGNGLVPYYAGYVVEYCVDCTKMGGTKRKPKDWPTDNI